jgi:putative ATP-binding cassette transporter
MGLAHLAGRLDESGRWDQNLTDGEQQAIAFARRLLHRPRWIVVDSAIDSLSAEARKALFGLFDKELCASTLVNIAGQQGGDPFFRRIVRLTRRSFSGSGPASQSKL